MATESERTSKVKPERSEGEWTTITDYVIRYPAAKRADCYLADGWMVRISVYEAVVRNTGISLSYVERDGLKGFWQDNADPESDDANVWAIGPEELRRWHNEICGAISTWFNERGTDSVFRIPIRIGGEVLEIRFAELRYWSRSTWPPGSDYGGLPFDGTIQFGRRRHNNGSSGAATDSGYLADNEDH